MRARLNQLASDLLPAANPAGNYSLQEQDRIRACRVLAHAEIEAFLEETASEIATKSHTRFNRAHKQNKHIKALTQTFCREHSLTGQTHRVNDAIQKFTNCITNNHGIKEKNIRSLFLPLGIDHTLLDIPWLSLMNSYGQMRGAVAHNSFRVNIILDPVNEMRTIQQLIQGIEQFDQRLIPIRRQA